MRSLILAAALLLGGCAMSEGVAGAFDHEARDDAKCLSWGTERGSPAYVQCRVAAQQARREFFNGLAAGNQAHQQTPLATTQTPGPITTTCFKRSEYSSGFNRICNYDCLGSAYATTIQSTQMCPYTVQR